MINAINLDVVSYLNSNLKDNIFAIIMFGSGSSNDFVQGISDLDYFILVKDVDINILEKIEEQRNLLMKKHLIKMDFKVILKSEFVLSLKGKSSFEFFNGWGLQAIKLGKQKILFGKKYIADMLQKDFSVKTFALERMSYYLHKLRKLMVTKNHLFHNEKKNLSDLELLKVISSSIKNVLIFFLAYKGKFVYTNEELILSLNDEKFKKLLINLFEIKKLGDYDKFYLQKCYNSIELFVRNNLE